MREYDFPWPNEIKGYSLFPEELESDPLVLFHGTPERNLVSIIDEGFKACSNLPSVSYAKNSIGSLHHVCAVRRLVYGETSENHVVIAVKFDSLQKPGIVVNNIDIHVYKDDIQPEIIGYCIVPQSYKHK